MSDVNEVRLLVDGVEYAGWLSVRIEAGIERVARSFQLSVTDRWPGAVAVSRRIKPGAACEVWIGADRLLTGYVDATPISHDAVSVTVSVRGRSKTADLVDCSAINSPGQWRGARVEAIATAMASVYGVSVQAAASTGAAVADHQIEPGESVFESLDRLLTVRQLLAADDGDGRLVLLAAGGGGQAATSLVVGVNVLTGSSELDHSKVYSEYVCKAQRATSEDDEDVDDLVTEQVASVSSVGMRRRVLVIKQSGSADAKACQGRVEYEQAYRAARAREARYTVQGWRQSSGAIWQPNQTVRVRDAVIGLDEDMLIAEVAWVLGDAGTVAELTVCPIDGYQVRRVKGKTKAKAGTRVNTWDDIV